MCISDSLFSLSSFLTPLLLSINGGRRKEDERSLSDDSFIRRAVPFQILIITLNYSQTAGLHCVGLNELSHTGTSVCVGVCVHILDFGSSCRGIDACVCT